MKARIYAAPAVKGLNHDSFYYDIMRGKEPLKSFRMNKSDIQSRHTCVREYNYWAKSLEKFF